MLAWSQSCEPPSPLAFNLPILHIHRHTEPVRDLGDPASECSSLALVTSQILLCLDRQQPVMRAQWPVGVSMSPRTTPTAMTSCIQLVSQINVPDSDRRASHTVSGVALILTARAIGIATRIPPTQANSKSATRAIIWQVAGRSRSIPFRFPTSGAQRR